MVCPYHNQSDIWGREPAGGESDLKYNKPRRGSPGQEAGSSMVLATATLNRLLD